MTTISKRSAWLLTAALPSALLTWTAAGAQDDERETIVVTAQRRAQDIQDVPIAITAVTASAIEELGVQDVSDLANMAPNVTLDGGTPFSGTTSVLAAYIRGIGQNDFAFNLDPGVGVYLDGVYLARTVGANQDLLDVDRVEILKGPQGTLFGRNTIGGAVAIVTRDPGDEYAFNGELTTGSYSRFDVKGSIDIPFSDALKSVLSFSSLTRDGYQDIVPYDDGQPYDTPSATAFRQASYETSDTSGDDNTYNVRYKTVWDGGGALRLTGSVDFTNTDTTAQPNSLLLTTPIPGPFAGLAANNIPGSALDVVTGSSGFLFAGLYNFCIGATPGEIAARNAQGVCGPTGTSENPSLVLPSFAGVNVDGDPLNNRLPYDDRFVSADPDISFANGNNFQHMETGGLTGVVEYDLGDNHQIKSITAYRYLNWDVGLDNDGTPLNVNQVSFIMNQWQVSQELQLSGSLFGDAVDYVVGAFYFEEQGDLHDFVTFSEGLLQIDGANELSTENYAVFGQADWALNDFITLQLGGRFTDEEKTFEGFQSDLNGFNYKLFNEPVVFSPITDAQRIANGFPNPGEPLRYFPAGENKLSFDNFSPRVGVLLFPTDEIMVYATYSEGYKTGGWTTRLSNPLPTAPSFDEETAESYEIGVKSRLLDDVLQLNAAVFTTKYDGIQLNFQEGVSPTIRNAGDATIEGAEVEAVARLTDQFRINASLGYLDATYDTVAPQSVVAPNPFQAGIAPGADLPKSPEWKFNIAPIFEVPLGDGGSLTFLADYTHQSEMWNDTERTFLLQRPEIDVVNANVTYREPMDRWEITVGGTNLTDERYITTGQAQIAGGQIIGTFSRPPEWYATLRTRF